MQLCNAYTADRRGAGFDLCESQTSQCVRTPTSEICTNLYWSRTEEGTDGYVFSPPGAGDLTAEEAERPVSCFDAVIDEWENSIFIPEGVLEYVRHLIEQFNQSNIEYSSVHEVFVGLRQANRHDS